VCESTRGALTIDLMRVHLLRAQSKHTEFIYKLYCLEAVKRGHGLHKSIPGPQWRNIIQGLYDGWQHIFVITNGVVHIGHVAFQDYSKEDRRAEVVVSVTPDLHRRGVGYDALGLALDFGFESQKEGGLGLESVWAGTIEDNIASKALFEKSGFSKSGIIPGYFRYGARMFSRQLYHIQA